ncbi:MAG: GNAT family N-acetyltransferase [Candidatus Thiodiazotropha sp. (ex Monitilora ramsayi)]|nr:GNAT family N-acetyltransferase [Candidatus Thiodiazotropha sp. (ex Monitilora ramsayi)]
MNDTNDYTIESYSSGDNHAWDNFLNETVNSSFLFSRKFLSYHGNRFIDKSLMVYDSKKRLIALFPAAPDPKNNKEIVSHPGISYGGLIHKESLKGAAILDVLERILEFYKRDGYSKLLYKVMPHIYHKKPCEDEQYALFRLGAQRYRCDLSASIFLDSRGKVSERRRRALNKARKANLTVDFDNGVLPEYWNILSQNLEQRHGAKPVHSLDEIVHLSDHFEDSIRLVSVRENNQMVAGVLLFETEIVSHAQYIAASKRGFELSALDMVFYECIRRAQSNDKRYFDFGISNEHDGAVLNAGLYQYKVEYGAGGVIHDFYELNL